MPESRKARGYLSQGLDPLTAEQLEICMKSRASPLDVSLHEHTYALCGKLNYIF